MMKRHLTLLSLLLLLGSGALHAADGYGGGHGGGTSLAAGSGGGGSGAGWSKRSGGHETFRDEGSRGGMSLDEAVNQVRRQTGGRILSANTVYSDGQQQHRIKVLGTDQRVRVITIEAEGH